MALNIAIPYFNVSMILLPVYEQDNEYSTWLTLLVLGIKVTITSVNPYLT